MEDVMNVILFVWTIVAASAGSREYYDWKVLTNTKTLEKCEQVAKELNMSKEKYRCVKL
jgi:hypothetical protein